LGVPLTAVGTLVVAVARGTALAHAGSLAGSLQPAPVPFWLVVVTGGGVVGVSFLFTSLLTDHDTIRALNGGRVQLPSTGRLGRRLVTLGRWVGVATLVAVVGVALVGPTAPLANLGVLVVWVGWWAGYTISTYVLGNTWRALNPWRTLAARIPVAPRPYPSWAGAWPSVVGLAALVFLEVVTPVADRPRWLGTVVVAYTLLTVAGGVRYGDAWFERADPVSRVFRLYGRLAPLQREPRRDGPRGAASTPRAEEEATDAERVAADGGATAQAAGSATATTESMSSVTLSVPGAALARDREPLSAADAVFVVVLLWVTSYDGLVSTVPWNDLVGAASTAGVPPVLTNFLALVVGATGAVGIYWLAAVLGRRTADTYVAAGYLARWFAPALLPIAAGYHLAHFLGYFFGLAPALVTVALDPVSPPVLVPTLAIPSWYGIVQLSFVVAGHVLAVWVAHARAFALFPGRLTPIRSQYPFVVVMLAYTAASLWIVAQPFAAPLT
jgi:hypothetical protein